MYGYNSDPILNLIQKIHELSMKLQEHDSNESTRHYEVLSTILKVEESRLNAELQKTRLQQSIESMFGTGLPMINNHNQRILAETMQVHRQMIPQTQQGSETWPFFISHAWEDKETFVKPLVSVLTEKHNINPWYDSFSLKIGDKLRQSIDNGIINSKFGIVVLSNQYFTKGWTEYELDGLFQLQNGNKEKRILPIWHNISKDEIMHFSPSLANIIGIKTSDMTIDEIADQLASLLKED